MGKNSADKDPDRYYDQISEGYEELHKEEQEKKLATVKDLLIRYGFKKQGFAERDPKSNLQKLKLLDVGCGTGITSDFAEFGFDITGLDPAEKLLDRCMLPIRKICAEAEDMPLPDKEFDIVASITAIQNFRDIEKGMEEIRRVGNDNALFALTFLKRSAKREKITSLIKNMFDIKEEIEEDKEIIFVCSKKQV